MDDEVHAEPFHPASALDAIVGGQVVTHHLDPEVAPGVDDPPNRRFVRAPHDDDEIRSRLGHHLGLEIAAVHRLQIGHDGMIGKSFAQRFHGAQAFRQQQRCAGLQPVHAGGHGYASRFNRFVERGQIE